MTLGEFLRLNKITQAEFSEKVGTSQRAVSYWVCGLRTPRTVQMQKIVHATWGRVTANDFLPDADE